MTKSIINKKAKRFKLFLPGNAIIDTLIIYMFIISFISFIIKFVIFYDFLIIHFNLFVYIYF